MSTTTPALPSSVCEILAQRARERPGEPCIHFEGTAWSNAEIWEGAGRLAGGLAELGVRKGTHVALMLENEPRFYLTWFGLARLGAVEVPVNTAFFGESLAHVLADSGSEVLVLGDVGAEAVAGLETLPAALHTIVVTGEVPAALAARVRVVRLDELDGETADAELSPLDPIAVMYTSGTTGVSKGVVLCHRYFVLVGHANAVNMRLGPEDRYLTCLPLFHGMAQLSGTMAPLYAGSDIVLTRRFSVSAFWDTCREQGVTSFGAIAAMTAMLYGAPPTPGDREHDVRYAFAIAIPASLHEPFEERFGVRLVGGYGLTEGSMLTYAPYDDRRPGSSGRAVPHFDVEIHDEGGRAVPAGTVGEIVCRPRTHGAIMSGYHGRPEATLEAWRGLWLHTGDLGRMDADGSLTFVDRGKDAIRRRGENISSFEVESAVARLPGVAEVAAYAVPSELGEDEVMLAVVPSDPGLSAEQLHVACAGVLPRFSLPAYIRFLDAMPYTPTNKVRKVQLREEGVTPSTWVAP